MRILGLTMSKLAAALVLAAQAIPHSYAPGEVKEQRDERVELIAGAAWKAAGAYADGKGWSRFEVALATVVLEGNESGGFDLRVHAGAVHPIWTQDHGLARCLAQIHETKDQKGNPWGPVPRAIWEKLAGLDEDATELCARVATELLISHAKQCGVYLGRRATKQAVAQAFASYGTGGHCKPDDEDYKRAAQWEALLVKYGNKPDVPGFRRVLPREIPDEIKRHAEEVAATISRRERGPGDSVVVSDSGGRQWTLLVERHAEGKIGVSAFVRSDG
jgi:hypothetical protein